MNRTALFLAALLVTASALLYIFGCEPALLFGALLCLSAGICFIFSKRNGSGYKAVAVLLTGAVFCIYLNIYYHIRIDRAEALVGQTRTVVCRVVEDPKHEGGYVEVEVETDGTNGFGDGIMNSLRLYLYINKDSEASTVSEGDILKTEVTFKEIDASARKSFWSEQVFVRTTVKSAEIIGHKESFYTYCVDLRRSIRNSIDVYTDGDTASLLKGILLGDISGMSAELYSEFKICGVLHITAVSGMHIGAFCVMVTSVLGMFMSRRKASAFAFIPLILTVMLAGATPSAVRSGIMCGIALLADCLLKKTDSLNSLGVAVAVMLIYNPFYILNLGFQLSVSASAGVILAAPYGATLSDKIARTPIRLLNMIISSIINGVCLSIGATVLTLPFQIIAFGFVSVVAPVASTLICAASVYAMAATVVGLIMHYIPYVEYIAVIPFWIAELLARYICVVVKLLAKVPFSYVPFGGNEAILCVGFALALIAIWMLLDRPGGKRTVSLLITVMLAAGLLADGFASRDVVEVAVLKTGNGLCTVVSNKGRCVIIGCGDDSADRYELKAHLAHRGLTEVEALFIPSDSDACFGGYEYVLDEISPESTVIPKNFGNSTVFSGGVTVAVDKSEFTVLDGIVTVRTVKCDYGSVFELDCYGKRIAVGNSRYNVSENFGGEVDCVVTSRVLPDVSGTELVLISADREIDINGACRTVTTVDRAVWVKLKPNKGMTVYAGQS